MPDLPAICTTRQAAKALFCKENEEPTRSDLYRVYEMINLGELTAKYKSPKKVQYLIPKKEILEIIGT